MKLLYSIIIILGFIAGAVLLCRNGNWFTGSLSLLCAVAVCAKTDAAP